MPGIGAIQVDFIADVAKFVSNINIGANALIKFGRFAEDSLKKIEKGMQEVGGKLTMKVTAPLLGLAYASIKASDPTNRVGKELKELGAQAQNALKPLGDVLIKLFEEATPLLHTAAGAVNVLAKEFSELAPHTQRMIVTGAAIAASLGPAALGLSAIATAAKVAASGFNILLASGKSVLSLLPAIGTAAVVATAAFASFELGTWAYENFKPLQVAMAHMLTWWDEAWSTIAAVVKIKLAEIRTAIIDLVNTIPDGADSFLSGMMNGISPGSGGAIPAIRGWASAAPASASVESVTQALRADIERAQAELQITLANIDRDFGSSLQKNLDPYEMAVSDISTAIGKMGELWDGVTNGVKDFVAESEVMGQSLPKTLNDVNSWLADTKDAMDDIVKKWQDWRAEAERARDDVMPEEKIAKAIEHLKELQTWFPEILSPEVFAKAAEKIRTEIDKTGAKVKSFAERVDDSIANFASDAGRAFADFVIDAKGSFDDVLKSWEKTLLAMAAKELVFGPLFDQFGSWAKGLASGIGSAASSAGSGGASAKASSMKFTIGSGIGAPNGESGGVGTIVQVIDQRGKGQPVQVSESQGPDGRKTVRVLIRDEVKSMMRDGSFDRVMSDTFGAKRRSYTH